MIVPPDAAVAGLSDLAVQTRVDAGQVNVVPPAPGRSLSQILRANVLTRFNAILGSLFVVVVIIGPPQDALFGAVLVVNTGIGVAQELRAKRALDRLAILTAGRARAVRNGAVTEIALDRIVLDDVLELARGDQVPVDGAVLCDDGLELDEALLTGEAEPVRKNPGDAVMSGSFVVAGTGRIRAAGVGADAYAARLQAQARRFSLIRSDLQQGTNQILRLVTWVMVPAGLLLILSEFFRSHDPLRDAARGSAAGVVAMVPEGLVLLTSLAFAAGALRLARHRVLVQELAAIEGLARAGVLCNDKTGTLTKPGLRLIETEVVSGRPGAQIDAEQHLALHDQAAVFHDEHAEQTGRQRPRRGDPVPADQPGPPVLREEREDPHPVPVGEPDRERPLRVEDRYPHGRPPGTQRQLVAHLDVLELRQDPARAVHVQAEQVLYPVVGVHAAPPAAHLHQPRPDRGGRRIDRDHPRGHDAGVGEQFVAGQLPRYLLRPGAPGEAPAPEEEGIGQRPQPGGQGGPERGGSRALAHGLPPWATLGRTVSASSPSDR